MQTQIQGPTHLKMCAVHEQRSCRRFDLSRKGHTLAVAGLFPASIVRIINERCAHLFVCNICAHVSCRHSSKEGHMLAVAGLFPACIVCIAKEGCAHIFVCKTNCQLKRGSHACRGGALSCMHRTHSK